MRDSGERNTENKPLCYISHAKGQGFRVYRGDARSDPREVLNKEARDMPPPDVIKSPWRQTLNPEYSLVYGRVEGNGILSSYLSLSPLSFSPR